VAEGARGGGAGAGAGRRVDEVKRFAAVVGRHEKVCAGVATASGAAARGGRFFFGEEWLAWQCVAMRGNGVASAAMPPPRPAAAHTLLSLPASVRPARGPVAVAARCVAGRRGRAGRNRRKPRRLKGRGPPREGGAAVAPG